MNKKQKFIVGTFYFHTKCHYTYIYTSSKRFVCIKSGKTVLKKSNPLINPKYYLHFRPALQDEINRALLGNPSYHCKQIPPTPATQEIKKN